MNHEAKPTDNKENPTRDEARAANRGDYAPHGPTKLFSNLASNWPLGIGIAGAGAAAAALWLSQAQDRPGIYQQVDNAIGEFLPKEDPSKFTVDSANSIVLSQESIKDLEALPGQASKQHQIFILYPIQGLSTGSTRNERDLLGKYDFNPIFPENIRQYAINEGIKNILRLQNIPAGITILAPVDGKLLYSYIEGEDSPGTVGSAVIYYDAPDGTRQEISISHLEEKRPGGSLPLIQAKPVEGLLSLEEREALMVPVKRGDPIFRTLGNGELSIGALARPTSSSSANELYPVHIRLLSVEGKVVIVGIPDFSQSNTPTR